MRDSWVYMKSLGCLVVGILSIPAPASASTVSYLYGLSDFNGTVPYSDVNLYADRERDEVYASVSNFVSVFNASGMENYEFKLDPRYGSIYDIAVEETGDILLLTLDRSVPGPLPSWSITRCDYRGQPTDQIAVEDLPPRYASFVPNEMFYHDGEIVLASRAQLVAVVTDAEGRFRRAYDLGRLAGLDEEHRADNDIVGFSVDPRGNILFTIATMFKAFVVAPDGGVKAFGRPGSNPGSFGIAAGIAGDEQGHLLVADRLRGVVMLFDRNLQFVTEFGSAEDGGHYLVRPSEVVFGPSGKIYITQKRDRGVAVFRLSADDAGTESDAVEEPGGGESASGERTITKTTDEGMERVFVPEQGIDFTGSADPVAPCQVESASLEER